MSSGTKTSSADRTNGKKKANTKKKSTCNTNHKKRVKKPSKAKPLREPPFQLFHENDLNGSPSFSKGLASVADLLRGRKNIIVLCGAGISVSAGIPDFRSKNVGLYETLDTEELGLTCPEDLFDLSFFQEDPRPFYKFARQLYFPSASDGNTKKNESKKHRIRPSDSHKLLALLEEKKLLLRCYTQNIDGLEEEAGVSANRIVYAHGSLQYATCCKCNHKVERSELEEDIWAGKVARCSALLAETKCKSTAGSERSRNGASSNGACSTRTRITRKRPLEDAASQPEPTMRTRGVAKKERICGGVLKPGVTFFGEALGDNVRRCLEADYNKVDACIVIGTSLSVAPISKVIGYLPKNIPRILINRTIVHPARSTPDDEAEDEIDEEDMDFRDNYVFDAYLLGFCDDVTRALAKVLFAVQNDSEDPREDEVTTDGCLLTALDNRNATTQAKQKKGNAVASDGLYSSADWLSVQVPRDRVFLFPGALPPTAGRLDGDDSSEMTYREVAHCDGCSKRINGTIRKCLSCFDYDLCETCFPTLSKTHFKGKHSFSVESAASPP